MKVVIHTDHLSRYYGRGDEVKVLDRLDLEVYEGETFGLLGPNGAGKTTTVRLLNCIIKPTSGSATVNDYDILKKETEVKRITGLLAESPGLYEKLSAHGFLEFMAALYDVPNDILARACAPEHQSFTRYLRLELKSSTSHKNKAEDIVGDVRCQEDWFFC